MNTCRSNPLRWLLLIEILILVMCIAAEMEVTTQPPDSADDSSSEEDEDVSGSFETRRRRRRFVTDEAQVDSDERTVVQDIATIGRIIQLLQAIGDKVIPIIAQGTAAVNKLLSTIGE